MEKRNAKANTHTHTPSKEVKSRTAGSVGVIQTVRNLLLQNQNLLFVALSFVLFSVAIMSSRHLMGVDALVDDKFRWQNEWWKYLYSNGWHGIITLNDHSGNYTTIWYFIIEVCIKLNLYPHFHHATVIKIMAIFGSIMSAIAVYFIVKHFKPESKHLPTLCACVSPFLPAFFFDAMKANLPDSIYIMFALWAFFCLLKGKYIPAWFLLGLGACFKLMAIYILPVFVIIHFANLKKMSILKKLSPLSVLISVIVCSLPGIILGDNWLNPVINPLILRQTSEFPTSGDNFSFWFMFSSSRSGDYKLSALILLTVIFVLTSIFTYKFANKENIDEITHLLLPIFFPIICFMLLPCQRESYSSMCTIFALIAYAVILNKQHLTLLVTTNLLIYFGYICSFDYTPRIYFDRPELANFVLFAGFMFSALYCVKILFKSSKTKIC